MKKFLRPNFYYFESSLWFQFISPMYATTVFDAGGSNLTKDASVESVTVTVSVTDWKVVVCYVVLLMNAILV